MHDLTLFLVGLAVGAMNAIAGGGMLLGFPVLLASGMPALVANATANIVLLPSTLTAVYGYRKYLKRVPGVYLLLLIPALIGATIGAYILRHTPVSNFDDMVPWLILFAVVLFTFQPLLYNQLQQHLHGPKQLRKRIKPLFVVGLAVFPLSIYGGYFGAGFGFIMLAFLGFTKLHNHIHRMTALKNIIGTCIAGASTVVLLGSGLIDWHHGLVMAVGACLGAYAGATLSQKISSNVLRLLVIIIGFGTAAYLGLRSY